MRTIHFHTPLKLLFIEGEDAIRHAVENDDPDLEFLQDIQMRTAGLYSRTADPDQVGDVALKLGFHAQSMWLAAVRLAFCGQCYAVPATLRTALESICYSVLISRDPESAEAWIGRGDGQEGLKASRKKFGSAAADAKALLDEEDNGLGDWVYWLYNKLIDEGAHPNPKAIWERTSMIMRGNEEPSYFQQTTDWHDRESPVTQRFILDCVMVGSCIFRVSAVIVRAHEDEFQDRFTDMKIRAKQMQLAYNDRARG